MEAALAELRPRRETRFAEDVKSRIKEGRADDLASPLAQSETGTIKISLKRYIRIAQFNAAAGGLLVGLMIGLLFGGTGVYLAMKSVGSGGKRPIPTPHAAASPLVQRLLHADDSLTPLERALLEEWDGETGRDDG
jgi:hypothetical protein